MSTDIGATRLGHLNVLVADHNTAVAHYRRLFDTEFFLFMHVPDVASTNTLGVIGDTCIELFAPYHADSVLGRNLAKQGPGAFAIEFTVADYEQAREAVLAHGLRITAADAPHYLWIHPADLGGLSIELSPAQFRGDPRAETGWSTDRWADGPLGIVGLRSISIEVTAPAAEVAAQLHSLCAAKVTDEGTVSGRDFVEVQIAGETFRLLSPSPQGASRGKMASLDFTVRNLDAVHQWARTCGVPVVEAAGGARLALPAELNLGTRIEFVQA
ncbi:MULTISPECIES: VOC family protein [Rhodococcus]|uniref:VOC family protein n=1 Tax=Rhodococcus oxybenzonivorans TaxID=1990687 RepID=A0AAE4UWT0_9NOCA|nr:MULTISPECIES: VOC family protein [Rhodococcus]MDV7241635.1 VOC family protein [Rhodococcus oxybenzonivorans]MDV7264220.1 VOC family protein [Rhodococcus oxybenzonivorans]MDV7273832.1 VOC family protein [Rhodococcus oxybenzonivorans]MDV7333916.1 VOC family protein [Rhodococcus oxybenzonivorans]MDV7343335.1 VOC family protein [Rhodococcus oxybenzonivorans]